MTASLPMYETGCIRPALDRLWSEVKKRYGHGPEDLDRTTDPHVTWSDPNLVLSQTCGLPYRTSLWQKVHLVGTPDYGIAGCPPGYYKSHLIVRKDDRVRKLEHLGGARLARNDVRSQSGWAAVLYHLETEAPDMRLNDEIIETGSHLRSVRAVRDGTADIAGIDAVTWAILARDTSATEGLGVLTSTAPTPGLPFITGPRQDLPALRAALFSALDALNAQDRALLMIRRIVEIPPDAYRAVPSPMRRT